MTLFPHLLIRVGGAPFETLEDLNLTEATRMVDEIDQCEKQIAVLEQKLSDSCTLSFRPRRSSGSHKLTQLKAGYS